MQLNPIAFDSVEQNLLWSALALQSKNYAPKEMRANTDPVPPYFVSVSPLADGANQGRLFARISANIELDPAALYGHSPTALAALPENTTDEIPSNLLTGLPFASSGSGASPLYSLPVSDPELFLRAENVTFSAFYPTQFDDLSPNNNHAILAGLKEFQIADFDGQKAIIPVFNDGQQSGVDLTNGTASLTSWTLFFTFAGHPENGGYAYILKGDRFTLYLTTNSIEIELQDAVSTHLASIAKPDHDGAMHLIVFTMDATGYAAYRDGALLDNGTWPNAFTSFNLTQLLTEYDEQFHLQDLVLLGRKSGLSELNSVSDAIANYRGIATISIS